MSLLDRSGVKASTKPTRRQPSILSTHRRPARSSPAPPARRSKRNETVSIVNRHPIPRDRVARIDARADKTETRRPRERARSTTRSIALDRRVAARASSAREAGEERTESYLYHVPVRVVDVVVCPSIRACPRASVSAAGAPASSSAQSSRPSVARGAQSHSLTTYYGIYISNRHAYDHVISGYSWYLIGLKLLKYVFWRYLVWKCRFVSVTCGVNALSFPSAFDEDDDDDAVWGETGEREDDDGVVCAGDGSRVRVFVPFAEKVDDGGVSPVSAAAETTRARVRKDTTESDDDDDG